MVSLQEYGFMSRTMFDQSIDRLARRRPSIDLATQENINRSRRRPGRDIGADPSQQFFEQIEAPVNVADGINPYTCRQRRVPPAHSEFSRSATEDCTRQLAIAEWLPQRTENQLGPHLFDSLVAQ
jgi:hypothetical protein